MSDLFGHPPDEGPATDRLFLAVLPDPAARDRLSGLAQTLKREHGLQGRALRPEHLHITLHHLGDHRRIPQNVVDAASRAVASLVSVPTFPVSLDRVVTFQRPGSKPVVAAGGEGVVALEGFHRQLQKALVRQGIKPEARFKPHATLLYDPRGIPERAVAPITWTVGEVVLVHSLLGKTTHEHLARWSLGLPIAPPEISAPAAFTDADAHWMRRALALAEQAGSAFDEVPVGAVIVGPDGRMLAEANNLTGDRHDPSAHAEMLAIAAAGKALGSKRLTGCRLYVSLEPCSMCASALVHARMDELIFAATSPKSGAVGSLFDVLRDHRHNHEVKIRSGLMADEAGRLLSDWFRRKRDAAP
jgi:tRNA(adenine34) deaminase